TVASGSSTAGLIPASGDQDHTISPSAPAALVFRRLCVHRIPPPTFVTIGRSAPPERAGCGEIKRIFLKNGSEYFSSKGLTLFPINRSVCPSAGFPVCRLLGEAHSQLRASPLDFASIVEDLETNQ